MLFIISFIAICLYNIVIMKRRVISATIGIIVATVAIVLGGWFFAGAIVALVYIGGKEFLLMLNHKGLRPASLILPLSMAYMALIEFFNIPKSTGKAILDYLELHTVATVSIGSAASTLTVIALFLIFLYHLLASRTSIARLEDIGASLLFFFYVAWLPAHILLIRQLPDGFILLLLVCIIVWGNDIGAFFAGKYWGKIKLYPVISPKKTVEGAIGGYFFGIILAVILYYIWLLLANLLQGYFPAYEFHPEPISLLSVIFLAILLGPIAQIGDLIESMFKRDVNIKDTSDIIPGHGGILDRVDSIILVCAPAYYFLLWFVVR